MSLQLVLDSALDEHARAGKTASTADLIQVIFETIADQAVRREVYSLSVREIPEVSSLEVNTVLDCLEEVLKGGGDL